MNDLLKKAIAECVGTFVLVFVACGVAGATGGSLVATSLAFGLTIVAMAYSVGRVSGCHINPAVSLGCLLTKRMTLKEFGVYVCAQIIGGFLGAVLVFGIFKMANVNPLGDACNYAVGFGANGLTAGGIVGGLITEIVLTCIFVYAILNVTDEKAGNGKIAGIVIGLTLTLVHLIGINLTGTSVNPARSIATAISAAIYNGTTDALAQIWIFIVGPLAGAALAACLYSILNTEKAEKENA
ncbi:MAG: aquaporin [Clostridiales bacterium]|nr:aquaporin [Clostridiales bacterium]